MAISEALAKAPKGGFATQWVLLKILDGGKVVCLGERGSFTRILGLKS